jgi:hypothetical protein
MAYCAPHIEAQPRTEVKDSLYVVIFVTTERELYRAANEDPYGPEAADTTTPDG